MPLDLPPLTPLRYPRMVGKPGQLHAFVPLGTTTPRPSARRQHPRTRCGRFVVDRFGREQWLLFANHLQPNEHFGAWTGWLAEQGLRDAEDIRAVLYPRCALHAALAADGLLGATTPS